MEEQEILTTNRKALLINMDAAKYGTLAEIGAGQEVARHFFTVGGAAGTVAKSMSAYDMKFSDEIYGKSQRYVSHERLHKMLKHEYCDGPLKRLLKCEDRNSMHFSIESRTPFADDIHLMDYIFSIPDSYKLSANNSKSILRSSQRNIRFVIAILKLRKLVSSLNINSWTSKP